MESPAEPDGFRPVNGISVHNGHVSAYWDGRALQIESDEHYFDESGNLWRKTGAGSQAISAKQLSYILGSVRRTEFVEALQEGLSNRRLEERFNGLVTSTPIWALTRLLGTKDGARSSRRKRARSAVSAASMPTVDEIASFAVSTEAFHEAVNDAVSKMVLEVDLLPSLGRAFIKLGGALGGDPAIDDETIDRLLNRMIARGLMDRARP